MFFTVRFEWEGESRVERVNAATSQQAAEFGVSIADPSSSATDRIVVEVEGTRPGVIDKVEVEAGTGARYVGRVV